MTFDDGTAGQFSWQIVNGATVEGSGGYPKIDPDCAVGMLDEFYNRINTERKVDGLKELPMSAIGVKTAHL